MIIIANIQLSSSIKIKRTFNTIPTDNGFDTVARWLDRGYALERDIMNHYRTNVKYTGQDLQNVWESLRMDLQCFLNADKPVNYKASGHRALALNGFELGFNHEADLHDLAFWTLLNNIAFFYVEARS